MKRSLRHGLVVLGALVILAGCTGKNPHTWRKGNLHTHTFWSDGDAFPETVLAWYRDHAYDFVALSDHNTVADEDRWLRFDTTDVRYAQYVNYLGSFGDDWVASDVRGDSVFVRLKRFEETSRLFNDPGRFLVIRSEEITDRFESKPIHVNATNIGEYIEPQHGTSVVDVMQRNVSAVLEQAARLDVPILPHINHPNYGWAVTPEELAAVEGERFFEIYNGHPAVHNEGDSLRPSVELMWDIANTIRLRENRPMLYGLAVDDSHNYGTWGVGHVNPGRGWIMVDTPDLTSDSIIDSMESGRFYASTGVSLSEIGFDGRTLTVSVVADEGVSYRIVFVGTLRAALSADGEENIGVVLAEQRGPKAAFTLGGDELYVRARVVSSRRKENPYREGEYERAWTQPYLNEVRD